MSDDLTHLTLTNEIPFNIRTNLMNKKETVSQLIKSFEQWKQISTRHYQQEVNQLNIAFDKARKLIHDDKFKRALQKWLDCDEPRQKKERAKKDFIKHFKEWKKEI